ncbi:tyrosine-type recombinase/integrase [Streptomyces kanamyceticus]|uniref:Site-specific integrase n=1 Tax=Streptomyces kanamyceticus TaxID=1967 RepID=A0A5J6GMX2_STRKN|nr:site-specific integrase [Streptomyces kanamyceticus]QEU95168.1 site-specific integrase [Streptomyces kanamyceticus]
MAGHVQDRWYKTEPGADGKPVKVKTDRFGVGLRYRARYIAPDGTEKSKSFPDKQKRKADTWLANIEADVSQGRYIDPLAGAVTFGRYAKAWMEALTTDPVTRESVEIRLRVHALPYLGDRPMASFRPSHLRVWMRQLEATGRAASYRRSIFANVSAVFTAAVEDRIIAENPCRARSVRAPRLDPRKVKPWTAGRVMDVHEALPDEYREMVAVGAGCGPRQGEIFGLAVEDIDFLGGTLHVVRQVKLLQGTRPVFGPPKGGKERDVPLPETVSFALAAHITRHAPVEVTLPWKTLDGPPVTASLLFLSAQGKPLNRTRFNEKVWQPALRVAGVPTGRENGMHALRHFYASVLLDAGESIKALSEYLGHHDPAFTLRTYTHLMPSSETRTRAAVDRVFRGEDAADHGPDTAQGED